MTEALYKHRLAGLALLNGVLIIGPTHWAASVRDGAGEVQTAVRRRPTAGQTVERLPALRGPIRLAEMLLVLPAVRRALPDARLAIEAPGTIASAVAGSALSRVLQRRFGVSVTTEAAGSLGALGAMLFTLRTGDLSRYHGAEHKVIGAYEQDIDARDATKEHERCGTQLALPMIAANALALGAARVLLPTRPTLARAIGAAAGLALSTEYARTIQRGGGGPVGELTQRIGTAMQAVGSTREPTGAQLEVAQAALDALLDVEGEFATPAEHAGDIAEYDPV